MEEINKFLRLLRRHRFTIIIIPAISIIITYFLVRNLPNSYVSQAQIATGLTDDTQQGSLLSENSPRGQEVVQEFSSIIEMMRMKKMLDQVSYQLIIHDLTDKRPFRSKSSLIKDLPSSGIKHAVYIFHEKYLKTEELNLWDKEQKKLYDLISSMKYDNESLKDKLKINRVGDSDFINVEFNSENPELSAFIANTLSSEFVKYYTFLKKSNQRKANVFLKNLLSEKKQ